MNLNIARKGKTTSWIHLQTIRWNKSVINSRVRENFWNSQSKYMWPRQQKGTTCKDFKEQPESALVIKSMNIDFYVNEYWFLCLINAAASRSHVRTNWIMLHGILWSKHVINALSWDMLWLDMRYENRCVVWLHLVQSNSWRLSFYT